MTASSPVPHTHSRGTSAPATSAPATSVRRPRVLVARLDSAGDVLVCGPAVRAIAASAEVWMLCGRQGVAAARLLPGVERVLEWEAPWIAASAPPVSAEHTEALLAMVRGCAPDAAVVLTSFHQSPLPLALLLRLAGVAHVSAASVDYPGHLLDVRVRPGEDFPEDQPEAVRALTIARAAGYELPADDDGLLQVLPAPAPSPEVAALVGDEPYVVVHPGASVPARTWPASRNRDAVELLSARGVQVLVTGGPGERELTREVAGDHGVDLGGRTDLAVLSGILERAAVVITGNTGPAHLAAAVGTPVVSLFSPVVPAARWAPYGVPVALLGDQAAPCRGTRAQVCPVPGHPCLADVTADEVVAACLQLAGAALTPTTTWENSSPETEVPTA